MRDGGAHTVPVDGPSDGRVSGHTCHVRRCGVPPSMLMCLEHWRTLPPDLKAAVWRHYRRGQELERLVALFEAAAGDGRDKERDVSPASLPPLNRQGPYHTMREIVADGAGIGTFKYPDRDTVHAYVELPEWDPASFAGVETIPYIACGLHGLIMARKHEPETMDCHGGPSFATVTCGRCRRVLGDALAAS